MATKKIDKSERLKKKFEEANDVLERMVDSWNQPHLSFPKINNFEDLKSFMNLLVLEVRKPWYKGSVRGYDETDPRWRKLSKEDFDVIDKCVKNFIGIFANQKSDVPAEDVKIQIEKL